MLYSTMQLLMYFLKIPIYKEFYTAVLVHGVQFSYLWIFSVRPRWTQSHAVCLQLLSHSKGHRMKTMQ